MREIVISLLAAVIPVMLSAAERPNILWITCEDTSPMLGCYGDGYAITPNLDALAAKGMRYTNAISNAPVCAPARTTIISGLYPPSIGAEHMRSSVKLLTKFHMYPQFLREAGYYATNNSKEDYNLEKTGRVWDVSNNEAHWKNRKPRQPFFAVFNHTISHESQIRNKIDPADQTHDPAKVHLPAYHPDTPEVRRDWAQVYDRITMMDKQAGTDLEELKKAGLADDTIVFFYSDHGSGMPRSKRTPCNSGLNVPFIVYFPPKWQHLAPKDYKAGGTSDRLISFVDLAPTALSLAGVKPPDWMQGGAFCGKFVASEPEFSFGFRGRMDERYDTVRSVRDKRYMYVRNFMSHRPAGQHNSYMFETPTTRVWKELFDAGKLNAAQARFWQPKATEELYELASDHDEVNNLADSPAHQDQVARMRKALDQWQHRIKDVGLLSEWEMLERSKGTTPFEMGHDPAAYDFDAVYAAASMASQRKPADLPKIVELLKNKDSGVRYWAAIGLLAQEKAGIETGHDPLVAALDDDDSPIVRITAAEALGRFGNDQDSAAALAVLLHFAQPEEDAFLSLAAWNALDNIGDRAASAKKTISAIVPEPKHPPQRYGGYSQRLKAEVMANLK